MRGRKHDSEPRGDILLANLESFAPIQDKRIEDRAPREMILVNRVKKKASTDRIFGKQHSLFARIPNGQRPIPNELGEALLAPLFISRRDNSHIGRESCQRVLQLANQLFAIV